MLSCPACHETFDAGYVHAGFADIDVLYCNTCPNAVHIGIYDPVYGYLSGKYEGMSFGVSALLSLATGRLLMVGKAHRFELEIQKALKPCACGGRFLYRAKPGKRSYLDGFMDPFNKDARTTTQEHG